MKRTNLLIIAVLILTLVSISVSGFVIRSYPSIFASLVTGSAVHEISEVENFDFTNQEGIVYEMKFDIFPDRVQIIAVGNNVLHFYEAENSVLKNIGTNEYFVLTGPPQDGKVFTHILRYIGHHRLTRTLTFRDLGTGIRQVAYQRDPTTAELVVGGITYLIQVDKQTSRLAIDQNGDGVINGAQAAIVDIDGNIFTQEYFTKQGAGPIPEPIIEPSCTDTDGGKNFEVRGTTDAAPTAPGGTATDYCDTTIGQLVEYYCTAGTATSMFYSCPSGCQNGACVVTEQPIALPSNKFYIEDLPTNPLNLNEKLGDVVETVTDVWSYLPSDKIGITPYNQYLRLGPFPTTSFGASSHPDTSSIIFDEDERDLVGNYLFFNDGDIMFEYELEFEEGLQSNVVFGDSEGTLVDITGVEISVLGAAYTISAFISNSRESMKFVLEGPEQIVFKDDFGDVQYSRDVYVDNDNIEDAEVRITGAFINSDVFEISSIRYRLEADAVLGDVFMPIGTGLRSQLDEPEGMLGDWDLFFESLVDTGATIVRIDAAGDDEYDLEFTNQEGIFYDIPLASNEVGAPAFKFGDDDDDLWFVEHENFVIGDDDFFVVSDCLVASATDNTCFSHVLRFDSIDTTNRQLTFTDLGTGTREITYDAGGIGNLVAGGVTYQIKVNGDSIAVDLNGDGNIITGTKAVIGIEGGGLISIGGTSALDDPSMTSASIAAVSQGMFTISLTTLSKEFDDTSVNEEILIDIEARANNKIGIRSNIRAGTGSLSGPLNLEQDVNILQARSKYGVFFELFDPTAIDEAEDLTIEYPLSQSSAKVYVGPFQGFAPAGLSCTDTDGGNMPAVFGTTTGVVAWWETIEENVKPHDDFCTTICSGSVGSGKAAEGPCLLEFSCKSHPNKGGDAIFAGFDVIECDKGCKNGACIEEQQVPCALDMVWTSDGEILRTDPYVFTTDICDGYRCVADNTISPSCYSKTQCDAACAGTCVDIPAKSTECAEPAAVCTDTDGGIVAGVKGFLNTNWPGWQKDVPDKCGELVAPGNYANRESCDGAECYLLELYCSQGTPQREFIQCIEGCNDGVCGEVIVDAFEDCDKLTGMDPCLDNPECYWDQETDKCYDYDVNKQKCTDPDDGIKVFEQAHTFGFRTIFANERDSRIRTGGKDACFVGNMLREYFCTELYFIETAELECKDGCKDGACTPLLRAYPNFFVVDNSFTEGFSVIVGDTAPASDVVALVDIVVNFPAGIGGTPKSRLASEIADITQLDSIIVGNACNNPLTAQLFGNPEDCQSIAPPNQGIIKIFSFPTGKSALVVAGRTDLLTRMAARAIANDMLAAIDDTEICVRGTSLTDIELVACQWVELGPPIQRPQKIERVSIWNR